MRIRRGFIGSLCNASLARNQHGGSHAARQSQASARSRALVPSERRRRVKLNRDWPRRRVSPSLQPRMSKTTSCPPSKSQVAGRDHETVVGRTARRAGICRPRAVMTGLALTPARADVVVQIDKSSQRMSVSVDGVDALQLAGLDRPQRLRHAERRIPSADDGAALVLAQILQFADAALDLLLSRLRHSRHQ